MSLSLKTDLVYELQCLMLLLVGVNPNSLLFTDRKLSSEVKCLSEITQPNF